MQVRKKYRIISGFVITKLKLIEAPLTLIPKSIDFSSTMFLLSEWDPITSFAFEASEVGQTSWLSCISLRILASYFLRHQN